MSKEEIKINREVLGLIKTRTRLDLAAFIISKVSSDLIGHDRHHEEEELSKAIDIIHGVMDSLKYRRPNK